MPAKKVTVPASPKPTFSRSKRNREDEDLDILRTNSVPVPKARSASPKKTNTAANKTQQQKKKQDFKIDPTLPMSADGRIYHLDCTAEDLADNIILVGDPGRVPKVSEFFDEVTYTNTHREINIHTGTYKGVRMTCLSTGMGTDNVEIVMNEIHALKEFDIKAGGVWRTRDGKGKDKAAIPRVNIIRVGTSGCPQEDVVCGSLAVSRFAIGMDNTCQYYTSDMPSSVEALSKIANDKKTGLGRVGVYTAPACGEVTDVILATAQKKLGKKRGAISGITASGSGFYGCQGREVGRFRGHLAIPDLVTRLSKIRLPAKVAGTAEDQRVVNIEMENSAICYLSHILGYRAATVCVVLAVRAGDGAKFLSPADCAVAVKDAIGVALDAMVTLDGQGGQSKKQAVKK